MFSVRDIAKRILNWANSLFEGAELYSPNRRFVPRPLQDARFDVNAESRTVIVAKSRHFEANGGLLCRMSDLFEQYTVGANGMAMVPSSSDQDWNGRSKVWWDEWCQFPDMTSRQPFGTLQSLIARSWFIDGDVFIHKDYSPDSRRPRVQVIECHRIKTPGTKIGDNTVCDGIQLDANGRPSGYWVEKPDGSFVLIPAAAMIHVFEPSRPGQLRGLPFCYSVINDLNDLSDLQNLEMKAAKEAAKIEKVIKTTAAEMSRVDLIRNGGSVESSDGVIKSYEKAFGGETRFIRPGDEYQQYVSSRPSVAVQQYWDYLLAKICAGIGISKFLVFPGSMQGTAIRADLDISNVFFQSRSSVLQWVFREIYIHVIGWAKLYDTRLYGAPVDWMSVAARPPLAVNVDVGRNSAATVAALNAGITNFQTLYAQVGKDWRTELRQAAVEVRYINDLCAEMNLKPGQIAEKAADQIEAAVSNQNPITQ